MISHPIAKTPANGLVEMKGALHVELLGMKSLALIIMIKPRQTQRLEADVIVRVAFGMFG